MKWGTREAFLSELQSQPLLSKLANGLFEQMQTDRMTYPFTIFREFVQSAFDMPLTALRDSPQMQRDWLGALSHVDLIVRNERRVELVRDLLRDAAGLKVHVVGKLPSDLDLRPEIICEGALEATELGKLMALSRWVVHCLRPTQTPCTSAC